MEKGIIKANELRIGNWVMDRGYKEWQIDHWETRNKVASNNTTTMCNGIMIETHPLTEYVDFLKPIPLTEEWLLRMGFELCNNYYHTYFDTYKAEIRVKRNGNGFAIRLKRNNSMVWVCNVEYVHSFQNLIHALTNEELTIKENGK